MIDHTKIAVQDEKTVELSNQPSFLGPRPLIEGEDAAAYDQILARLSGTVKPKDVLEEIWVRDVVDLTWDTLRMRRLKAALLASAMTQAIAEMFRHILEYGEAEELSKQWALRDSRAVGRVEKLIASMGLTMEAVVAQALSIHIDSFERIDRMVMNAEAPQRCFARTRAAPRDPRPGSSTRQQQCCRS